MNDCIVKQYGCSCAPGECAQPKPQAPVICFKWRHHLITIGFGAVMTAIAYLAMSDYQFKPHALDQQEAFAHVNRN